MSALCRDEQLALRFIIGQLTFLGVQKSILGKPSQLVPNILKQQEEENDNGYFFVVVLLTYILGHMHWYMPVASVRLTCCVDAFSATSCLCALDKHVTGISNSSPEMCFCPV